MQLRKKKNLKEKKTRIKFDITHWYFFREFMREIKERRRKKNKTPCATIVYTCRTTDKGLLRSFQSHQGRQHSNTICCHTHCLSMIMSFIHQRQPLCHYSLALVHVIVFSFIFGFSSFNCFRSIKWSSILQNLASSGH